MTQQEDVEAVKRVADQMDARKAPNLPPSVPESHPQHRFEQSVAGRTCVVCGGLPSAGNHTPYPPVTHLSRDFEVIHYGFAHDCQICMGVDYINELKAGTFGNLNEQLDSASKEKIQPVEYDAVNPPHYQRGPKVHIDIGSKITEGNPNIEYVVQCIDVMRRIQDPRLATALRYLWRVAFGGKEDPNLVHERTAQDKEDLNKAKWYLDDFINNPSGFDDK